MATYPFRSALITGASSGIGEVLAGQLADHGVRTVVVARRERRLADFAACHDDVEVLAADLSSDDGLGRVVARILRDDIDLVVNNAGFGTNGEFHAIDPDRLITEIDLNIGALTRLSHAALSVMVPRGSGWLLNVSSITSFQPAPRFAVYAATKAYVTSLSESLHEEVSGYGVHVTALCPGLTKTEFSRVSNTERYVDRFPGIVWTSPDEVAREGLRAVIANQAIVVPGPQYKLIAAASNVTPRWLRRKAASLVQRA